MNNYEEMLSIPLRDGSRLKIGESFSVVETYPFFSEGLENYNATLQWCDEDKMLVYVIYPISDRVSGRASGGTMCELNWNNIVRRSPSLRMVSAQSENDSDQKKWEGIQIGDKGFANIYGEVIEEVTVKDKRKDDSIHWVFVNPVNRPIHAWVGLSKFSKVWRELAP